MNAMPPRIADLNGSPRFPRLRLWWAAHLDRAMFTLGLVLAFALGVLVTIDVMERRFAPDRMELIVLRENLNRLRAEPVERTLCTLNRRGVEVCIKVFGRP